MKNKTRFATTIYLGIAIFITLGCQLASQTQPAPVSDPASDTEPAKPPTDEPTETPPLELDLSSAVLTLEDLPPGFEEYTLEDMGMTIEDFGEDDFQPEEVFVFINTQDFQMVFGFNFLLAKKLEQAAFDVGISQPDVTLPALINGIGSENVQDEKILEGYDDIGEKQIAMSMIADMEGTSVQVDVLMFRRDIIGAMVLSMNLEEQTPIITIHELGQKLDQRVKENLQAMK